MAFPGIARLPDPAVPQTLDGLWRDLSTSVHPDCPPALLSVYRRMFYAGAAVCFGLIERATSCRTSPEQMVVLIDSLSQELERFRNSVLSEDEDADQDAEVEHPGPVVN